MLDTLPALKAALMQDMLKVDQVIREAVRSEVALIDQIGHYIIEAGGKRMRPLLTLMSGKILGYEAPMLYRQAAMIEFIHTSTLLHDDVVDESGMRRGRATANQLFGNAAAVLVGDFLYTRSFQLMVSTGDMRILEVMANATNIIAEGEVLQLMNIGNIDITEAQYLNVIQYKTAKLFEAAAQVGAMLAQARSSEEQALADYGMHLGTAFQIMDDILDYSGSPEDIGKNVGDDLAEGKPTLPLIYLMQHGSDEAAGVIRQALTEADRAKFPEVLAQIRQSDALDYAHAHAQRAVQAALQALMHLPDNEYNQGLQVLAQESLARLT